MAPREGAPDGAIWTSIALRTSARSAGPVGPGYLQYEGPPGAGRPLDDSTRARFERGLGTDLSGVRLHTGASAAEAAAGAGARAFTAGRDVVFGAGEYDPDSARGRRLLAHELVHVAQGGSAESPRGALRVSSSDDAHEREADGIAADLGRSVDTPEPAGSGSPLPSAVAGPRTAAPVGVHRAPVGSNGFGSWDLTQTNHDGATATDAYWSRIKLVFAPDKKTVDSSEIAFVQTFNSVDASGKDAGSTALQKGRMTPGQTTIDTIDNMKSGWMTVDNSGKYWSGTPSGDTKAIQLVIPGSCPTPYKNAEANDSPGWATPNMKWSFETATIAKKGKDAGKLYGAVTWGFSVDAKNKLTSHKPALSAASSSEFKDAVTAWNTQAASKSPNAPGQETLGPFK